MNPWQKTGGSNKSAITTFMEDLNNLYVYRMTYHRSLEGCWELSMAMEAFHIDDYYGSRINFSYIGSKKNVRGPV